MKYLRNLALTLVLILLTYSLLTLIRYLPKYTNLFNMIIFIIYITGTTLLIYISKNDRLFDRILNFTFFIIFNSPLAIYTIVLFFKTYQSYFIKVGDSSSWISFAGSIIGGSMTMFAIIFTIQSHDNTEAKKVIPHISIDLSDLYNIENNQFITQIRLNHGILQLGGNDTCWINFILTNTSSFIAKNVKVLSTQSTNYNNGKEQTYNEQLFEINHNKEIDLLTPDSKLNLKVFFDNKNYIVGNYFDIIFTTKHTDIFELNHYISRFVFRFYMNEILDQTNNTMVIDYSSFQFTESPLLAKFSYSKIENSINLEKK